MSCWMNHELPWGLRTNVCVNECAGSSSVFEKHYGDNLSKNSKILSFSYLELTEDIDENPAVESRLAVNSRD